MWLGQLGAILSPPGNLAVDEERGCGCPCFPEKPLPSELLTRLFIRITKVLPASYSLKPQLLSENKRSIHF